jgi:hypothetical protein
MAVSKSITTIYRVTEPTRPPLFKDFVELRLEGSIFKPYILLDCECVKSERLLPDGDKLGKIDFAARLIRRALQFIE